MAEKDLTQVDIEETIDEAIKLFCVAKDQEDRNCVRKLDITAFKNYVVDTLNIPTATENSDGLMSKESLQKLSSAGQKIQNITAEIDNAKTTTTNTVYSSIKDRLNEDKNSIWIRKEGTYSAVLNETSDKLGSLEIIGLESPVLDKDTITIVPILPNGDWEALTGEAFKRIEKDEKIIFLIDTSYYTSLYYDILDQQGGGQGEVMGTLEFPITLNVKVSYLSATSTKINTFTGIPDNLQTTNKDSLVSSINELNSALTDIYKINVAEKTITTGAYGEIINFDLTGVFAICPMGIEYGVFVGSQIARVFAITTETPKQTANITFQALVYYINK